MVKTSITLSSEIRKGISINNLPNIAPGNWTFLFYKLIPYINLMNHYELLYLISASYSEDELTPLKETVKQLVEKHGGKINFEDSLGKKKLAYPINNIRNGYYLVYEFDIEPSNIVNLDRDLTLTAEVVRHQIVSKKLKSPTMVKITEEKIKKEKVEIEKKEKAQADKEKIKLEDLDKKLDEILDGDLM